MKRLLAALSPFALLLPVMMLPLLLIGAVGAGTSNTAAAGSACRTDGSVTTAGDSDTDSSAGSVAGAEEWVNKYGKLAFDVGKKYGIPYEAILVQGAVESAWGSAAPHNNFFGLKVWKEGQDSFSAATQEEVNGSVQNITDRFVAFDSVEAGWNGYGQFITENSRYANALQEDVAHDPMKYLETILADGYATASWYMPTARPVFESINAVLETRRSEFPPSSEVEYDRRPPAVDGSAGSDGDVTDAGSDGDTGCATAASDSGSAQYGSVGGAPTNTDNYAWMCDWGHICEDGDGLGHRSTDRNFYAQDVARYQCVWYAWNRLAMIHGGDGWSWVTGNGGQIAANASGVPGWEVSSSPKPGDGVSFLYNHVAVVEKVEKNGSGWKIFISEGNVSCPGDNGCWNGYSTRWVDQAEFGGQRQFFRFKEWKK